MKYTGPQGTCTGPAEPIGKFEIRTTEEPARFWPAQKVSEVYFLETDMQDTV